MYIKRSETEMMMTGPSVMNGIAAIGTGRVGPPLLGSESKLGETLAVGLAALGSESKLGETLAVGLAVLGSESKL